MRRLFLACALLLAGCFGPDNSFGRIWYSPTAREVGYVSTQDVRMPANAPSISNSFYQLADPAGSDLPEGHLGIDVIAPRGTPVLAAAAGTVVRVFSEPLYGKQIVIRHVRNAAGQVVYTHYKHLDSQQVQEGQSVARGAQIGGLGNTGVLSGGILHLHFEVQIPHRSGRLDPVDPHRFWLDGVGQVTCFEPARQVPDIPFAITYPVVCR